MATNCAAAERGVLIKKKRKGFSFNIPYLKMKLYVHEYMSVANILAAAY